MSMAGIDYGVVVFQNGKQLYGDRLYPDVEFYDLKIVCYKSWVDISLGEKNVISLWQTYVWNRADLASRTKSAHFEIEGGYTIHVKEIYPCVYRLKCSRDGQHLTIIYGYGIDPNWKVWKRVKVRYLGREGARKVDNEFRRAGKK